MLKLKYKLFLGLACLASVLQAQTQSTQSAPTKPRTMTRLFWQDSDSGSVRWGNVLKGDQWQLTSTTIEGFPKLDTEECELVQMKEVNGVLLTGVRDHQDGAVRSGWIAIDCGVDQEPHGDHFHWKFGRSPVVKQSKVDTTQGNPAHLYAYDNRFYMANDSKNGFTVVDPAALAGGKAADKFFSGGGGHITMAAIENKVCYATWIDREGDNLGRVDVVPLGSTAKAGYKFQLPSGGIHGATANSGKVFFAPSDGICWVMADTELTAKNVPESLMHLSLGKDANDKPLRTGAFANHLQWVMCVTGTGPSASLCLIDAKSPKPSVTKFALNLDEGTTVTTPVAIRSSNGQNYALAFQESKDGSQKEKLLVLQLDANGDGQLGDVSLAKSIDVGASRIDGHSGHHELTFAPSRRLAFLTNPGDGEVWILSLTDLTVQAKLKVGGTPTHVVAVGG